MKNIARYITLSVLFFLFYSMDFVNLTFSFEVKTYTYVLGIVSVLHVVVLSSFVRNSVGYGWRLLTALFLAHFSTNTLMVAIEAVYLPETLPSEIVVPLVVNGAITSLLFDFVVVLIWGKMHGSVSINIQTVCQWSWWRWILKFLLVGFLWSFLFVFFGGLVFLPLAQLLAAHALADYANMNMPVWVLPFQFLRGMIWAGLTIPLIGQTVGTKWQNALRVGGAFAVLMGTNLLLASEIPFGLRIAHLVEVSGENFIYGALIVLVFHFKNVRFSYFDESTINSVENQKMVGINGRKYSKRLLTGGK